MATSPSTVCSSQSTLIQGFQEKIGTGKFTCGGTLQTPSKVQVNYLKKAVETETEQWSGVTFPGLEDADFQQILESSTFASFGKGKETVTNKSYRDAYALDPEKFITSFQVSDSDILGEVRFLLVPDVPTIRAELYKMNIYTAPTGCFKAHVDTPRGGNMFGSLVVCLPSQFTGGALVTRHNGEQVTYDWSSPADDPVQSIRWAAFYSDVEHEILQVTEGHRVTLTYNLYHCDQIGPLPTVDVTTSPFYNYLKAALDNSHFLCEGGVLGFACQHAYIFEEFNKVKSLSLLLKGSDRTVLLSAKSLGLTVEVKSIVSDGWRKKYVRNSFEFEHTDFQDMDGEWIYTEDYFEDKSISGMDKDSHITWCQTLSVQQQPAIGGACYGNECTSSVFYQTVAILVTIPHWSERHQ